MSIFPQDRNALRRMYVEAWRRHRDSLPLEPLEAHIADVVALHTEYHDLLELAENTLERDWMPEEGETNPFLHMGMHLAIREQVATNRPMGIAAIHARLLERMGAPHPVEHLMMECLGATLWESQRNGLPPDESVYLEALKRL
jgi:hypothetical protein